MRFTAEFNATRDRLANACEVERLRLRSANAAVDAARKAGSDAAAEYLDLEKAARAHEEAVDALVRHTANPQYDPEPNPEPEVPSPATVS
jgi:hypothetical protein